MDASLDNANNPFSTSNGAADIQQQKSTTAEGLLLNLDSFKSTNNGTNEFSPDELFNNDLVAPTASNTNGKKKKSSPFDGDDFGPETDVDAVDEAVLSPSSLTTAKAMAEGICNNNPEMEGGFNPFMDHEEQLKKEDKMDLEIEQAFGNDNVMDFKPSSPREETPTPPADTVQDGGLIENPGDSESEDEWNYFKGDDANKETRNLSQSEKEIAETSEDDNMSNLNPNAAEFVPVSPTRSAPSPICKALLNDEVIAQSPKRPTQNELDINVPSPVDFEKEVKSRPSEVDMFTTNGHSDNEHNDSISSQENRENQDPQAMMADSPLNGKTIDEMPEFQPSPIKTVDEFHFGPNAAPFSPARTLDQSEAGLSTRAVCGDESTILNTSFNESDMKDSMSMSIYQDKDEGNPFDKPDLNQVQLLPDNLDEFLQKSNDSDGNLIVNDSMSDTISDLPEHNPLEESGKEKAVVDDEEKELASPLNETSELDSDLVKNISDITPEQEEKLLAEDSAQQDLLGDSNDFLCTIPKSPIEDLQTNNSLIEINNTEIKESEQAEKIEKQEVEVASPINNIDNTLIPEVCPISSPVSVATTDVNSFLDRSELPDVASPLSPNEQKMDEALSQLADQAIPDVLSKCVFPLPPENHQFDVRTENITPEFAQEAILSPGEHSDASEVPTAPLVEEEPVPEVNKTEPTEVKPEDLKEITDLKDFKEVSDLKEVKSEVKEVKEEVPLVEKIAPVAAEVVKTEDKAKKPEQKIEKDVKKSTVEKKSSLGAKTAAKPSGAVKTTTTTAARKPISKSAAAAPRAPTAAKTATSTTTAASKPAPRPTTARPKTAPATARTAATTERKPLTNGVAKTTTTTAARSTLTAKKTDSLSKTPTKPSGATSTTRTTPLKSTTTKTSTVGATAANKTAASPRAAPAAAASRPMTLSRPATARTTTSMAKTSTTTATKTMSSTTTTSRTTTSRPTTARTTTTTTTSTTLSKPRVPATRTITKSSNQPDTEKQLKESANKMTASRTATRTTTSTARKSTETKTLGNRTTAAKSTTSTTARTTTTAKKPAEIVRSKTTKTTKIEKPKENGIAATTTTTTVVTEQLIAVNDDVIRNHGEEEVVKNTNVPNDDLIKDNSPIDNKLILENNTLNETTTAAD